MQALAAFLVSFIALGGLPSSIEEEATWAQWRGPDGTGISRETAWSSEGKEESLWESEVGLGYSTMVVGNGRLYTMGHDVEGKLDLVFCLDALTGEELWSFAIEAKIWNQAHEGGTINTPTLDGGKLFVLNREGNLYCLDAETGDEVWHESLIKKHELKNARWGFSGSPLVSGENLILNVGKVISIQKDSGATNWISAEYGDAYCTPVPVQFDGKHMLAIFNQDYLALLNLETGAEISLRALPPATRAINSAAPIQVDDALFVSSSRLGGSLLLAFGEAEFMEVWSSKKMVNGSSASMFIDDHFYGFTTGGIKCLDLEGEELWLQRGVRAGAMSAAGKRLIILNAKGELVVAQASPEGFSELSRAQVFGPDDGKKWSLPVIAGGLIYCRASHGRLICRDHRKAN